MRGVGVTGVQACACPIVDPDPAVLTGNYPAGGPVALDEVFGQLFARTEPVWTWAQLGERMAVTRLDRKSVVSGQRVDLGGRRIIYNKTQIDSTVRIEDNT